MPRTTRTYGMEQLMASFDQHRRRGRITDRSSLQRELEDWFANPSLVDATLTDFLNQPSIIEEIENNREDTGLTPEVTGKITVPKGKKKIILTVTADVITIRGKQFTRWRNKRGQFAKRPNQ